MGGRGAGSGESKGNALSSFKRAGTQLVETDKLDMRAVNESLSGLKTALDDLGVPLSEVTIIAGRNKMGSGDALMGVNGFGQVSFSNKTYSSYEKAVKDTRSDAGEFTVSGLRGTGAHEAGHVAINALIKKTMADKTNLERATARRKGALEKSIIKEAAKRYGSNPRISKYGSTSFAEKLSEAVADVTINRNKANPYSKTIVSVLKERLRG